MTNQWKTIERYAYLGVAMSLVILVCISSISYQSLIRIQEDYKWATNTREILLNLSYFLSDLKDAEMGQREYLLTGQESYLKPYQYVERGVKQHFADMRIIATNNVTQQKKLNTLESLVTEQLSKLKRLVSLQKNKGVETAKQAMITGTGKQIMNDIQTLILEMDEDERLLSNQRTTKIAARVKYGAVVKNMGIVLILITSLLVTSGSRRWLNKRKKKEKQILLVANNDGLTGLPNRRHFFDIFEREILQARIKNTVLSVLMLDLDHFKSINDTYGHLGGDAVLRQMGKILSENIYPLDVAARYGGEEFVILMPSTSAEQAVKAAERLCGIIDKWRWEIFDRKVSITVSIGLASIQSRYLLDSQDILKKADEALYAAKRAGRNCVVSWEQINLLRDSNISDSAEYREMQAKVSSLARQLKSHALGTISALTETVNMVIKDPYIIQHGKNVKTYAMAVANEMGFSSELTERIGTAALLQDIGKICIPVDILKKTTPLTAGERELINKHPEAATRILKPIGIFNLELEIVRHHHENFDGTGYPDGLKGREIPIGSRILTVADTFDAITSERKYCEAQSCEDALKEIQACSNKQFAPDIVEAFLSAYEKHKANWPLSTKKCVVST